ncbi:hypothetical protein TNCV_3333231 [Trichonephila clavipes]|nr:hypothetical protein TNCV_3333231 [Trichonephila clavipes]
MWNQESEIKHLPPKASVKEGVTPPYNATEGVAILFMMVSINHPKKPRISFKDLIPITLCVDSTRIKDVQWCTSAKRYAVPRKDFFVIKSVDFCYAEEMEASSTFYSEEDSTRITLSGESRVITDDHSNHHPIFVVPMTDGFSFTISDISCWMQLKRHKQLVAERKG